jgi:hypothetical protein
MTITLPLRTAAVIAGLGAGGLIAGGLITTAPPANAGCLYGGPGVISKCDDPVQPDGTWQRCLTVTRLVPSGMSSFLVPERRCNLMGPGQGPADLGFADPPMHIDG